MGIYPLPSLDSTDAHRLVSDSDSETRMGRDLIRSVQARTRRRLDESNRYFLGVTEKSRKVWAGRKISARNFDSLVLGTEVQVQIQIMGMTTIYK